NAGAQSVPASLTLTVRDARPPTLSVVGPVNNALVLPNSTVDVVFDAADDVALASVSLTCNPALAGCESRPLNPPVATSRQAFTVTLPPSLQAPQTVSLSMTATDTSGNVSVAGRVLQIADTVKPLMTALQSP